jgi:hypothetical protein
MLAALLITLIGAGALLAQETTITVIICPRGQGFWGNHPENWTVDTLVLGNQTYTFDQLMELLPGGGGDASLNLAVQLIAAKLNVAAGTDPIVAPMIIQADALLAQLEGALPYGVEPASALGQQMISLAAALDTYNSGFLVAGCALTVTPSFTPSPTFTPDPNATAEATPEVTPEVTPIVNPTLPVTIIIEGPVEEVNINIITIYNIDIEVNADDPILTVINIGDFVRVEGDIGDIDDAGVVIIIPINIFVVDVDVNTDVDVIYGGDLTVIWMDDGDCAHGPPPWAPAHGWRRRCEQPINNVIIITGDDHDHDEDDDD